MTISAEELEIEAFLAYQREQKAKMVPVEPLPEPTMIPEFACMSPECGRQFRRSDCNKDNATRFGSVKRCPFCKSDRIYKQYETLSDEKAEARYSPDIGEQIGGLKENKHFTQNQLSAGRSGRMQRKKY